VIVNRSKECPGRIFNIERNGQVDGPGIRTVVFFKGCPLQCRWCHNPESQSTRTEILYDADRCLLCGTCAQVCLHASVDLDALNKVRQHDRDICTCCGACVRACPAQALEMAGYEVAVNPLVDEITRGAVFYRRSGGGVTLSGGEPLLQPDFCLQLLTACRDEGIHTALDTCGQAKWQRIYDILPLVDLFLYDLKHVDDQKHRAGTGVSNHLILDNLAKLAAECRDGYPEIIARIPVIPGFNATIEEVGEILAFLQGLDTIRQVEILPFHHYGESKYRKLQKTNDFYSCPLLSGGFVDDCAAMAEKSGFEVIRGESVGR
jgi:pyruvate formate lyase activating enzyme